MRDMLSTAVGLFMIAAMTVIILLFVIPSPINYIILAVLLFFFAIFSWYLIINKLNTRFTERKRAEPSESSNRRDFESS